MANLKKAELIAAHDELEKVVGIDPPINTKKAAKEFEVMLYQTSLDIVAPSDKFSAETQGVFDALATKFPDMVASPDDDEKSDKKEKKTKKGKSKKVKEEKKEAPVKEKAAPKAKEKKGKAKKGAVDPAELAESLKTNKKISRDEMYAVVDDNPTLFGDNAETLKTITNPMVLKKQMRNVLEGGKVEMTKTKPKEKKEKKAKVSVPTLGEQVAAIEDVDELKALVKANKDAFPGVKAKKFDKIKKLRKALLEVIVEPEVKKKGGGKPKAGKSGVNQTDFIRNAIRKGTKKSKIEKALAEEYSESTGWAANRMKMYEKAYGEMGATDSKLNPDAKKAKTKKVKETPAEKPEKKKGKKDKKDKKKKKK